MFGLGSIVDGAKWLYKVVKTTTGNENEAKRIASEYAVKISQGDVEIEKLQKEFETSIIQSQSSINYSRSNRPILASEKLEAIIKC